MSVNNKLGHRWFGIRQEEGEGKGLIVVSLYGESQGGGVCHRQFWKPIVRLPEGKNKQEWRRELIPYVQSLTGTRCERADAIREFVRTAL